MGDAHNDHGDYGDHGDHGDHAYGRSNHPISHPTNHCANRHHKQPDSPSAHLGGAVDVAFANPRTIAHQRLDDGCEHPAAGHAVG